MVAKTVDVLIMDEPSTGLDPECAIKVVEAVSSWAKQENKIVIMTIHSPPSGTFAAFDRLLVLNKGRMAIPDGFVSPEDAVKYFDEFEKRPDGYSDYEYVIYAAVQPGEAKDVAQGRHKPVDESLKAHLPV